MRASRSSRVSILTCCSGTRSGVAAHVMQAVGNTTAPHATPGIVARLPSSTQHGRCISLHPAHRQYAAHCHVPDCRRPHHWCLLCHCTDCCVHHGRGRRYQALARLATPSASPKADSCGCRRHAGLRAPVRRRALGCPAAVTASRCRDRRRVSLMQCGRPPCSAALHARLTHEHGPHSTAILASLWCTCME